MIAVALAAAVYTGCPAPPPVTSTPWVTIGPAPNPTAGKATP
jgi:hypothetical protein